MVKGRLVSIALIVIVLFAVAGVASSANAQTRNYTFSFEYAKLWINTDATVDLFYNVSLTLVSGPDINYVSLGQPNGDFTVGQAFDQYGNQLQTSKISSNGPAVEMKLNGPLKAGNTIWLTVTTNVGNMLSQDTVNPGNLGMEFAPEWQQVPINDVRVQIVMPPNVTTTDVKTLSSNFWQNAQTEPDGRLALYWQKSVLAANEQWVIGVSFPASSVPGYGTQPSGGGKLDWVTIAAAGAGLVLVLVVVSAVIFMASKRSYKTPKLSMETLGARRGLTAVEASSLLELKPTQIVTEILYSLLQKRAVWVESTNPSLKLRVMPEYVDKKGPNDKPLRYYEIDFLEALKPDGTLNEEKLAKTIMFLRDTLEQKLSGYSRKDTVDYYRKIVDKAWTQVDQAGTGELASKAYDEQLLWLLLDPNYKGRTQTTFTTRPFEPNPLWFWWWYGYTHYNPHIPGQTNAPVGVPTQSAPKPTSIPGADFANNIATSVEKTSGNIVADFEKFANAIVPAKPSPQSHQPAHNKADCVCACAACACACACVSCACACAGGGVR